MLTADEIQDEIGRAFSGDHGAGCSCCEPFPGGSSPLELAIAGEARLAIARFDHEGRLDPAAPSDELIEATIQDAARDAVQAARAAITAAAVRKLATVVREPVEAIPVVAPIDPTTHRISCRAETFDGTHHRQCTRPASFTRDGLEVCRQHARLASTRPVAAEV